MKYKNILILLFTLFTSIQGFAQLTVSTAMTPTQLVQNVLTGGGVTITNVTYSGLQPGSIGSFSTGATPTNLGITNGIIIATGLVDGTVLQPLIGSPATNFLSNPNGTGSDTELANLVSGLTVNDASVLQFDFVPLADTIKFRYVFASEEYPEFVGSGFNDVFGFFVTGPNPPGVPTPYVNKNIALIPGTTTPVTINNVNSGLNATYYIDNQGMSGTTIVYDGFTTVLTAWCKVIPCQQYHLKIAIGDVGDQSYDSGVFLEANSFTSNAINVTTAYSSPTVDTVSVEGCNDAIVSFTIANPTPTPLVINYTIGGTATNGVDYLNIPTSVTIPAGQDSVAITISPIMDGIAEPTETVTFTFQTSICGGSQTVTILIKNNTPLAVISSNDTSVCNGQANISVIATGGIGNYTYTWDNGIGNVDSTTVSPTINTTYNVTVSDVCGAIETEQIIVSIGSGFVDAGNDTSICIGGTASLLATGATGTSVYSWQNGPVSAQYNVQPIVTTMYHVDLTGGCAASDSVLVTVLPLPVITITTSLDTICNGGTTQLNGLGATNYTWSSNPNDPSLAGQTNIANPIVTPIVTTTYTLAGTDLNTCANSSSITITVIPIPTSTFEINPADICIGQTSTLTYLGNASPTANYSWNFGGATTVGAGQGPYQLSSNTPGIYQVTLIVSANGCTSSNSVGTLTVNSLPTAQFSALNIAGCAPLATIFQDNSINTSPNATYSWNFGDGGGSSSQNPTYTYYNSGIYSVSLTVSNAGGCSNTQTQNALINVYPQPEGFISINPRLVSNYEPKVNFYGTSTSPVSVWNWSI
ncbi:MAG: PKD domain-containing protein, partial [Bacteroidetes bacterium]|nr:PKD domain-containing protein [Bacteroidota bacterium]